MNLTDICAATGMKRRDAKRMLLRYGRRLGFPPALPRVGSKEPTTWNAGVIEVLRQIKGQGYDLADRESDWLAQYLKGTNDQT